MSRLQVPPGIVLVFLDQLQGSEHRERSRPRRSTTYQLFHDLIQFQSPSPQNNILAWVSHGFRMTNMWLAANSREPWPACGFTPACLLWLHMQYAQYINSKILILSRGALGGAPCLLASRNLEKTEVGATLGPRHRCSGPTSAPGGFETAQERSGRPQDGSESAPAGLKTAPRALREAPGRLQERSGRPQDGPNSAPAGSRRLQERSGRPQDGFKSIPGGSRRPQERSGRFRDDQTGVPVPQSGSFLESTSALSRSCSESFIKPT